MATKTNIPFKTINNKLSASEFNELNNSFNSSVDDINNVQLNRMYDESTARCIPYMFKSSNWTEKVPRLNIMMFPDFNDEWQLLNDAIKWVDSDALVKLAIQAMICNGDMVTATKVNAAGWIAAANNLLSYIPQGDIPILWCNGNHDMGEDDCTDVSALPTKQQRYENLHLPFYNKLPATHKPNFHRNNIATDLYHNYFYFDLPDDKVRIFSLDEFEYPILEHIDGKMEYSATAVYGESGIVRGFNTFYSKEQMDFLVSSLESCPSDYLFILVNHINANQTVVAGGGVRGALAGTKTILEGIINAYRNNTAFEGTSDAITGINAYTVSCDFSANIGSHPVIHLRGHDHSFMLQTWELAGSIKSVETVTGGTSSTSLKWKNSITRWGCDILSYDNTANTAYFLMYGHVYNINKSGNGVNNNGFHYYENPLSLI